MEGNPDASAGRTNGQLWQEVWIEDREHDQKKQLCPKDPKEMGEGGDTTDVTLRARMTTMSDIGCGTDGVT